MPTLKEVSARARGRCRLYAGAEAGRARDGRTAARRCMRQRASLRPAARHAEDARDPGGGGAFAAMTRRRGGRGLRADPAEGDPGGAAPRLPEPARFRPPPLARRRPIERASWPATRKRRSWRCGWEEGSIPVRSAFPNASPIEADETAGDLRTPAGADRRRPDSGGAAQAGTGNARTAQRSRDSGSPMRPKSTRRRRASTGTGRHPNCATRSEDSPPFPGAWCEFPRKNGRERMKLLRARCAERSGTAGTVFRLDPFVVACGADFLELTEVQPAGKKPATAGEFLRGARLVLNLTAPT